MMSSGSAGHNSGTLPPMQYPSSSSDASGVNMNMYALHERNENTDYDETKTGKTILKLKIKYLQECYFQ